MRNISSKEDFKMLFAGKKKNEGMIATNYVYGFHKRGVYFSMNKLITSNSASRDIHCVALVLMLVSVNLLSFGTSVGDMNDWNKQSTSH